MYYRRIIWKIGKGSLILPYCVGVLTIKLIIIIDNKLITIYDKLKIYINVIIFIVNFIIINIFFY